jgi:hypothetical protein
MTQEIPTISWDECLRSIQIIIPNARSLDLNEISRAMEWQGYKFHRNRLADWEELDDMVIFQKSFGQDIIRGSTEIILIPWLCFWGKHLPFLVNGDSLEEFVKGFFEKYGECFFNGDTVVFFVSTKILCLFNHDGMYVRVEGQRSNLNEK